MRIRVTLVEDDRHELVVEFREDVFVLDIDDCPPGVPFDRVVAPELRAHALQRGEATSAGGCPKGLETAEEFISVPAGREGQKMTARDGAVLMGFAGPFHVDIVNSRHFCLCLLEIWVRVLVAMWSNAVIELDVTAREGFDVSGGVGLHRYLFLVQQLLGNGIAS